MKANKNILIAEDSPTQAAQLQFILENKGYTVFHAFNGNEAMIMISKEKPDLIISDIMMPEKNGYQLCEEIKASKDFMNIPVILLTSLSSSEDVLEGLICGADNFLTKPYKEDYLLSHVEQMLANKRMYETERVRVGVEILFGGKKRFITATQQQMLTLLISTYEAAVQKNTELLQAKNELKKANEYLEEIVKERTAELSAEIVIRKRSEEYIKKLNRLYKVLSSVNKQIIHSNDRQLLFDRICQIAVEEGKFTMAWIGIVDKKTNVFVPLASAGKAAEYVKTVNIDLNDDVLGDGPIGRTIKTGVHYVANDIANDSEMIPWRENALKLGNKSSAAFPIKPFGEIIGALVIYSKERFFFDKAEIDLLNEMVGDVSFALEYIVKEAERMQIMEELEKREASLTLALDTSHSGTWDLNLIDYTINRSLQHDHIFGYNKMLPKWTFELFLEHVVAEDRAFVEQSFNKAIETQSDWKFECRINRADGEIRWIQAIGGQRQNSEGVVRGMSGLVQDITNRKSDEQEITMLAHALKSINECVSITDVEDKILFVNRSFLDTYGFNEVELIGKSMSLIRSANNPTEVVTNILPATIRGAWSGELMNKRKDGSEFPVSLSTTIIKDKSGKLMGLIGVASDITERKHNEQKLISALEKATESDRLKSAFLATMSHELRTPLNAVIGFSSLVDESLSVKEMIDFNKIINSSGYDLLSIIDDIFDITLIEAGDINVKEDLVELNTLLEKVNEITFVERKKTNKEHIKINFKKPDELENIKIYTDLCKLKQILINLLKNALKFTEKGHITYGYCSFHTVDQNKKDISMIKFFVEDSGIGISENDRSYVFDIFRKVEKSDTTLYGGVGIGLSISKKLVEYLGGNIWLESEEGKGSTFYFTIPYESK